MPAFQENSLVIPARPELLQRLDHLINHRDPGINQVASLIKTDVSLYANTLALINSAYTGLRRRVTCIHTAVRIMGVKRMFSIIRMASVRSSLSHTGRLDQFWDEANLTAVICSLLSENFNILSKEDAYALGMMSNCGVPLLYKELPGYKHFYEEDTLLDLHDQHTHEQMQFETNRFDVSSRIAEVWLLPQQLCQVIKLQPFYHQVLNCESHSEEDRSALALLLLAKEFSLQFSTLWGFDSDYQPVIDMDLLVEQLCLTTSDINNMKHAIFNSLQVNDFGVTAC